MKWWLIAVALAVAGCPKPRPAPEAPAAAAPAAERKKPAKETLRGRAVWYGGKHHGGPTASGERFDKHAMTAAHRNLPLGTKVRVTNKRNGNSVIVRINDRGPYGKDRRRIIDVSEAAAKKLDFIEAGWTEVVIEVLERPPPKKKKKKKKR